MTEPVDEDLERSIVLALERAPVVEVPAEFAARIISAIPATRGPARVPATFGFRLYVGRSVAVVCVVLLFAAMLWLAGSGHGSTSITVVLQCALCAEYVGLMLWLTLMPRGLR